MTSQNNSSDSDSAPDGTAAPQPSKARDIVVVAVVAIIALMLGVNLFVWLDDGDDSPIEGMELPALTLEVAPGEGEAIDLADLRGKAVVMDFWAEWCTACKAQMPLLEALAADESLAQDVKFLSVNVDVEDQREKVERFLGDRPLAMKTVLDTGAAQQWFRIVRLPTLVFVDSSGVVAHVSEGVHDEGELRSLIDDTVRR